MKTYTNSYANDGKCHNAEQGTYGHECGKPATWIGEAPSGDGFGFCDKCKEHGYESKDIIHWQIIVKDEQR